MEAGISQPWLGYVIIYRFVAFVDDIEGGRKMFQHSWLTKDRVKPSLFVVNNFIGVVLGI
ncbi:MAG: hypothetical protein IPK53_10885 [bacterium]|nr:hypothetical protein [bacterium]